VFDDKARYVALCLGAAIVECLATDVFAEAVGVPITIQATIRRSRLHAKFARMMIRTNPENSMESAEMTHREHNLNAHFAWALALWGSAETSRQAGSTLCAAYSYYFSVVHAGYAWMNALPRIPIEDLQKVDHQVVLKHLGFYLIGDHANELFKLKQIREATSYLAIPEPATKLRIVQGHPFGFTTEHTNRSFFEALDDASLSSKSLLLHLLSQIQHFSTISKIRSPAMGDATWQNEYLNEDMFLHVFPEKSRGHILRTGFSILNPE